MTVAVHLDRVTKRFSGHLAVSDLSLTVPAGGIFGLLGPNGAGKSTTIRMIINIFQPDEGKIALFGGLPSSLHLSARLGYLPEERGLYKKMRVLDQLIFFAQVKGVARGEARRRALAWLERLGVADWAGRKVEDLSKGMQQKVQFAGALLHDPELVILDEPFAGLDPVNSQVMKEIVIELARSGRTVLFSTHIMEQAEKMCERVAIIARGRKVVDGTLAEIKREFGGGNVALTFSRDREQAVGVFADRYLVAGFRDNGASAEVTMAENANPEALLLALVRAGVGLSRFEVIEPSLETIFIARAGENANIAPALPEAR